MTAFVRTPSKLTESIRQHKNVTVFKGDASSQDDLLKALPSHDAVVQAAVYGTDIPFPWSDKSGAIASQKVVSTIIDATVKIQYTRPSHLPSLRFWLVSGQVLLDAPGHPGKIVGDIIYLHPEHYSNYAYLLKNGESLDWSLCCPGKVDDVEVNLLYSSSLVSLSLITLISHGVQR